MPAHHTPISIKANLATKVEEQDMKRIIAARQRLAKHVAQAIRDAITNKTHN